MKIPTAMDDSSVSHHNGGQVGSQIGVSVNNKQNDEPSQNVQYSIPGILHFIQHEWARFELERSQWEVDRAEYEVIICNISFVYYMCFRNLCFAMLYCFCCKILVVVVWYKNRKVFIFVLVSILLYICFVLCVSSMEL